MRACFPGLKSPADNILNRNYLYFQTKNNKYIFSANTGKILRLGVSNSQSVDLDEIAEQHPELFGTSPVKHFLPGASRVKIEQEVSSNLRHMTLGVTEDCNLRCRYCVYSGDFPRYRNHSAQRMSQSVADASLDYFIQHAASEPRKVFIGFYGGEPLLNVALLRHVVQRARAEFGDRVMFAITTNGTLLSKKIAEFLVRERFLLTVSLDGPAEQHDAYRVFRNGHGSFSSVHRNLERLRDCYPDYFITFVSLCVTVTARTDYEYLERFFSSYPIRKRVGGVDAFGANHLESVSNTKNMSYLIERLKEGLLLHRFDKLASRAPYSFAASVLIEGLRRIHNRPVVNEASGAEEIAVRRHCIPGSTKLFVGHDGRFFACEKVDGFSSASIGDVCVGVDANKVHSLLNKFANLKTSLCCNCFLRDICDICVQHAAHGDEWDIDKMTNACDSARKQYLGFFSLYASVLEEDPTAFAFLENETPDELVL